MAYLERPPCLETFACLSATCNLNELDAGTKLFESNKVIASFLHVNCSLWTLNV
jgi:hypothetical protein